MHLLILLQSSNYAEISIQANTYKVYNLSYIKLKIVETAQHKHLNIKT